VALGDDDAQTARFATTSLAALGGPIVEDRLLDRLDPEYPTSVRANAVFVLGRIGGRETLERIEALTDDESPAVRKRAFSAVTALRSGGV
jgi:HEAT repeat protein